jgi:alkylation response protein AidB-like acyl-CoA dehydrogenase
VDLRYTAEQEAFRAELQEWLQSALPQVGPEPDRHDWAGRRAWDTDWQRMLFDAGYAGIDWPEEFGGRGATPAEHLIFLEETEKVRAPYVGVNFVGLGHAGPTLIHEGTAEHQGAHLEGILKGEHVWCQGFSEPGAGSDLASLQCKAVRDGDEYVISGQKIWTSFAHIADYCEMLVRTDPSPDIKKHKGISWLIVPMDLPGIDVRPLETVLGSSEFSEVFFDEVRVPVSNRVGEENDGWRVTMVTLSFERGTAFVSELVGSMELVNELAAAAKTITRKSATAWDDVAIRREIGSLAAEFDALWALTKRNVSQAARDGMPGPGGNVFKLRYADARERLGTVSMQVFQRAGLGIGELGSHSRNDPIEERIYALSLRIAAGTSQVNKNIIGERVLGLPKG